MTYLISRKRNVLRAARISIASLGLLPESLYHIDRIIFDVVQKIDEAITLLDAVEPLAKKTAAKPRSRAPA
jgi:hypothetical protein